MLPHFFIDRPVFAWVIALVVLLGGIIALSQLPIAQYPEVAPPALNIRALYPGASAETIENTVTSLIEQEMNGIEHLLYMESSSDFTGSVNLTLTFEPGTNLDVASVEAQNRLKRVEPRLPEEVRRQGIVVAKSRRNFLMFISLYSPQGTYDNVALGNFTASQVLEQIRRVPGVGEAELFGTEYAMRIWLHPDKLNDYQLSVGEVLRAIRSQNTELAMGEIGQLPARQGQVLSANIVTKSALATVEEFQNVILRTTREGTSVRLKDVAEVKLGAQDYSVLARRNGQPTAAIGLKLAPDANALDTAKAVTSRMEELAPFFPTDIAWDVPYDTSRFIQISIQEVVKTLLEAFGLVFLVMWLFLGNLRAAFIPTIVVPLALIGGLVGIYAFGFSINVLTLFAMVLAIGIVVDDAIVVVENTERIMTEEGLAPREATRKGMDQIMGAIIGITLVLSAVFIPMALFGGSVGAIYRQFAVTLVLTMLFSALFALTLTPALCANLLKPVSYDSRFNRGFNRTRHYYVAGVGKILKKPLRVFLLYLALVLIVFGLLWRLPTGFLPEEDQGYFISIVQLPSGATQERTLQVLSKVENFYLEQPEVARVVGVAGFSFFGRGQNGGITFTRLNEWSERKAKESHVLKVIERATHFFAPIKEALIFVINPPSVPELGAVGGFDFRLQDRGNVGREKLLGARNVLLQEASSHPALMGVRSEAQEAGPQLLLEIDRLKAQSLGIDFAELNETLAVALGSEYVHDFVREGRVLRVILEADAKTRATPDGILNLRVRNREGELIALSEIAKSEWRVGFPKLDRYNGVPAIKIGGSAAAGKSTGEARQAMEEIAKKLPFGIGFEWSGTSFEEVLSEQQIPLLFVLSIFVVFLCLAALYESWLIPLSVILVVPVGVLGSVLAVMMRGLPNDVYFKVGLIAIIGLSAKNAILIVQFARVLRAEGKDLLEATVEACRLRFRPIVMTSLAFMMGVLPLAVSTGAGAASRHAIGTGVMGGMLTATVLAIFFIPVLFVLVQKINRERGT